MLFVLINIIYHGHGIERSANFTRLPMHVHKNSKTLCQMIGENMSVVGNLLKQIYLHIYIYIAQISWLNCYGILRGPYLYPKDSQNYTCTVVSAKCNKLNLSNCAVFRIYACYFFIVETEENILGVLKCVGFRSKLLLISRYNNNVHCPGLSPDVNDRIVSCKTRTSICLLLDALRSWGRFYLRKSGRDDE